MLSTWPTLQSSICHISHPPPQLTSYMLVGGRYTPHITHIMWYKMYVFTVNAYKYFRPLVKWHSLPIHFLMEMGTYYTAQRINKMEIKTYFGMVCFFLFRLSGREWGSLSNWRKKKILQAKNESQGRRKLKMKETNPYCMYEQWTYIDADTASYTYDGFGMWRGWLMENKIGTPALTCVYTSM